jgi:two-component system cell cycle sensor histidine kinase/response regulator CckA
MGIPLRVLIVEDSEDDVLLVLRQLRRSGYEPSFERVDTAPALRAALAQENWDVVIADFSLPRFDGLQALDLVRQSGIDLPFILVSGTIGEDVAVAAMKAGAHDYVLKDNLARLGPAVDRELQEAQERLARRQAEHSLRESEARFRKMAENIQDGLTIIEHDQVVYVNERACEIFGYPRHEYVNLDDLSLADPEEQTRLRSIMEEAKQQGKLPTQLEYWIRRKDGTRRCIQNRYSLSRDGDQITGRYVVTTDITERKLAEREVEERRRYLERVLGAAPDAIVTLDAQWRIAEWNPGAERLFGYSREEAIGRDLDTLIAAPGMHDEAVGYTQQVMGGQELPPVEIVRRRQDGSPVDAIMAGSPIIVENKLVGVVAVYTDISERKRAERLLQALNEAALAVEQALTQEQVFSAVEQEFKKLGFACAILLTDLDRTHLWPKHHSYETTAVKATEKLLRVKAGEWSIPIEAVDVFRQVVWEGKTVLVEGDDSLRQVLPKPLQRFTRKIVKILQVSKSIVAPLFVEDEVIGVLSVQSEDLTTDDIPAITAFAHQVSAAWRKAKLLQDLEASLDELKRTQAQFLQAQKMEAVGRLAGGVAHDFNNTLTVIHLSLQFLKRQLHGEDPLWEYVQQIEEASDRAGNLTKQLLSFSRREIVQPRVVNLNQVVVDLSRMLQRLIGEDIELVTHFTDGLWPVCLDPTQIDQALINLVVNARDAMPNGGRLTIETANVLIDQASVASGVDVQPGEYARLAISDTGVGIDAKAQEHIFEPFFTTKEREQGTGLGLSTVFGIVKQNNGDITVHSAVGQGATFTLYLPRSRETEHVPGLQIKPVGHFQGTETILVVEDEIAVRNLAARVLRVHGYQDLTAGSGSEALRISQAHEEPIHLLLTDMVMPGMSGQDLATALQPARSDMRVLFMSGHSHDMIAHHGMLDGQVFLLSKPFTMETLTQKVREVLDTSV